MRSIFVPLKLDAQACKLELETYVDPRIDQIAKFAAYLEEVQDGILHKGKGFMMGDETRLRQIINNLASNASKFTLANAKFAIKTSLVYSSNLHLPTFAKLEAVNAHKSEAFLGNTTSPPNLCRLSAGRLQLDKSSVLPPPREVVVAGLEIDQSQTSRQLRP